jgi:hypothetical protein
MKKSFLLSIVFATCSELFADKVNLISYFKEIRVPFSTEQIYSTGKEIPNDLSLRCFFKNDTTFAQYYYELYSNEDNKLIKSGYKKKKIFAYNFFYLNRKLLLIYELYSAISWNDDPETILAFFNEKEEQTNGIVISYANVYSSPELSHYIKSKIYVDSIIVFDYKLTVYDDIYKQEGIKTIITVTHYAIDAQNDKFIKTKTEEVKSKYDLYLFDEGKKEEIKQEDPYYKY